MVADPEAADPEVVVPEAADPEVAVPDRPKPHSADVITDPTMTAAEDITVTTPAANNSVLAAAGAAELSLLWPLSQYICL